LNLSDWFYASILTEDRERFASQRMGGNKVFCQSVDQIMMENYLRYLIDKHESISSIVAAGYALEESVIKLNDTAKRLSTMISNTVSSIQSKIYNVQVNGDIENRLPGMVNLRFDGISGESLMHLLDLKGICVSTSSACNAGKDEPSYVLLALGQTEEQARSAIRVSYGRYNTEKDSRAVVEAVCELYGKALSTST